MFVSGPPVAADVTPQWGIRRIVRRSFPHPAELAADAAHTQRLATYLADMLAPYDLGLTPGAIETGVGQSYGEMAAAVIEEIVPDDEEIDLLVLAYAIPDITPGRATATYLSHICPGNPFAFAICDQGSAAGFTGLQIMREYARAGACDRALLVIVEQADLPYDTGAVRLPAGHTAVALLCGAPADEAELTGITIHADVTEAAVAPLLRHDAGTLFVLSPSLEGHAPPGALIGPGTQTGTGVWWELADALGTANGPILLADFDSEVGFLSVATFEAADERSLAAAGHGGGLTSTPT